MPIMPKTKQDAASLKATADTLAQSSGSLHSLAELMRECGFETLDVTHHSSLLKALLFVDNYVAGVRTALVAARKDRGDFEAKPPVSDAKPTSRKKRG